MEFIEPHRPGRARLLLAPTLSKANIACCGQYLQAAEGAAAYDAGASHGPEARDMRG